VTILTSDIRGNRYSTEYLFVARRIVTTIEREMNWDKVALRANPFPFQVPISYLATLASQDIYS